MKQPQMTVNSEVLGPEVTESFLPEPDPTPSAKRAIMVRDIGAVRVALSSVCECERNELIAAATDIQAITDEFSQACAVDALRGLNGMIKAVETTRKEVKAPVLDLGTKIDTLAKEFTAPITAEVARLNKLVTAYAAEQRRIAEEAERARQAELARIAAEQQRLAREEAARKEGERQAQYAAELARRQAEEDAQRAKEEADSAFTAEEATQATNAGLEAQRKAQEAAELAETQRQAAEQAAAEQRQREADLTQTKIAALIARPGKKAKPAGLSVREVWKFEVLNVHALYAARPDLCRVEANASEINKMISGGIRQISGLRIYSETAASVRS